ncbi:MAG: ribulose-phosphate 3-epimerase [Candidatus Hydrothermota bacterium]|nr:MAG: ribulose-phosphate 3-epimerase [Candidatus Hydrothermae bacterium]
MSVIVSPSILSADFSRLEKEIRDVELGGAEWLHLDVMDGVFVPNLTFGPIIVAAIDKLTGLFLDVHLMIIQPRRFIEQFVEAGGDLITFHIEAENDVTETIKLVKDSGAKVGISLNPPTPVDKVVPYLEFIDLVLVMSVNPGFAGQRFLPDVLKKVEFLRNYREWHKLSYLIEIDGGINLETGKLAVAAGVDVLVSASFIFGSKDRRAAIQGLKSLR